MVDNSLNVYTAVVRVDGVHNCIYVESIFGLDRRVFFGDCDRQDVALSGTSDSEGSRGELYWLRVDALKNRAYGADGTAKMFLRDKDGCILEVRLQVAKPLSSESEAGLHDGSDNSLERISVAESSDAVSDQSSVSLPAAGSVEGKYRLKSDSPTGPLHRYGGLSGSSPTEFKRAGKPPLDTFIDREHQACFGR